MEESAGLHNGAIVWCHMPIEEEKGEEAERREEGEGGKG